LTPLAAALVLLGALAAVHLLLVRTPAWKAITEANARLPAIAAIAFVLALAAWPLGMNYLGLLEGQIECVGRFCHGQVYGRATTPIGYWIQMGMLFALGAPMFSFALKFAHVLLRTWSQLPNRLPLAGVATRELRRRDAALLHEQNEAIANMVEHRVGPEELQERLRPLLRQRTDVQIEIDRRERSWKRNRVLVYGLAFLVLVLGGAALVSFLLTL
jgi:hypothetical protein